MNPLILCVWFILVPLAIGENVLTHGDDAHRKLGEAISGQSFIKLKKALAKSLFSIPYASSIYNGGRSHLSARIYSDTYGNSPSLYPSTDPTITNIYEDDHGVSVLPYPGTASDPGDFRDDEICCADCRQGDIRCLARCVRVGCRSTSMCAAAGDGAYAAFCQRRCNIMAGMSVGFLPKPACRGLCASQVQRRCRARACQDYECYVPECEELAPAGCDY